ncbi:hypothetical protein [Nitrosopumilus oxyclinae]|uniref:hypothetical protein n=1 Tax=Nitrosopumilus oxyclinae TaxID=1959104 RepID=UPI0015CCECA2|nr:hypothetical protein [Nitrosopumilus oxyclinae]
MEEIKKKFIIRDVYEIKWATKNFSDNMKRFYGPKLGNVLTKTSDCGTGPLLLIVISDPNPKFGKRRTSNGMELVNINLFDNKKLYRKLTGVGYAIHSSITDKETNDDLTMLLGKNVSDLSKNLPKNWDGKIKKLESDLIGQNEWKDMNQLFYVLNSTTNYVVLRNFEKLPENYQNYDHNDIDILTDDFLRIPYIANGGKSSFNKEFPPFVKVGGKSIKFDFGYPEDNYFDKKWAYDILNRRVFEHGLYIPSKEDYFYSLFYHAVFHQQKISDEYKNKLTKLSIELKLSKINSSIFDDIEESKKFIEKYMKNKGYLHTFSKKYRIFHNPVFRLVKVAILLWKTQGMNFLLTASKNKFKKFIKFS